ncbi:MULTISPECIES: hypothetical protein [unclassified Streptomyces]|uniref:hypothetical protein n=1 Tax=unclassified Streptomyces TaxID=2593676 RepID=UPI00403C30CF
MSDAWSALTQGARPNARVVGGWLTGLGLNRAAPAETLVRLLHADEMHFLYRTDLPAGVLDAAVAHPSRRVRGMAAESGNLSRDQWDRLLAATAGRALREVLAEMAEEQAGSRLRNARVGVDRAPSPESRPPGTPAEIAAMADTVPDIEAHHRSYALSWIAALHDDPAALRQLASSEKLLIRRGVARAVHLPPDVVELPAHDEDRVVRLSLTECCDDAPAGLLLDCGPGGPAASRSPAAPATNPTSPATACCASWTTRSRACGFSRSTIPRRTPTSSSGSAAIPTVRCEGGRPEDPRLSPEAAVGPAQDTAGEVHRPARRNPALPPAFLVSLLLDERGAQDAARNPALPVAVMHRMIELTGKGPHAPA